MIPRPIFCSRCGYPAESINGGRNCVASVADYLDRSAQQAAWETVREIVMALADSNMNISNAARRLHIPRNTLWSRIMKIKKATGYDCTDFRQLAELWNLLGGE